jgi:hypothetical protein
MSKSKKAISRAIEAVREAVVELAREGGHPAHVEARLAAAGLHIFTKSIVDALVREGRLEWLRGGRLTVPGSDTPCALCLSRPANVADAFCAECAGVVEEVGICADEPAKITVGDELAWVLQ